MFYVGKSRSVSTHKEILVNVLGNFQRIYIDSSFEQTPCEDVIKFSKGQLETKTSKGFLADEEEIITNTLFALHRNSKMQTIPWIS